MLEEAKAAMDKAKIALMTKRDTVFFSALCFSMKHEWNVEDNFKVAVEGLTINYNPEYFLSLTPNQRVSLLIHETLHITNLHNERRGERDPDLFNTAADYAINILLQDRGFELGDDWLVDEQFRDMTTEEIYHHLRKEQNEGNPPPPNSMPDLTYDNSGGDGEGNGGLSDEKVKQRVEEMLVEAQIQSEAAGESPGNVPSNLQIMLQKLLKPRLPWQTILARWMNQIAAKDFSFRRPNRRMFPQYYLPSLHSEGMGNLWVFLDTSGSVSDHDFHVFVSELASIVDNLKPEKITLVQFDHGIKSVHEVRNINELKKVNFTGRGGTCLEEPIQMILKNKPEISLVFTDGYFWMPNVSNVKTPILWVIHNNEEFTAPKGKVIHYHVEERY